MQKERRAKVALWVGIALLAGIAVFLLTRGPNGTGTGPGTAGTAAAGQTAKPGPLALPDATPCAMHPAPIRIRTRVLLEYMQGLPETDLAAFFAQQMPEVQRIFRTAGIELAMANGTSVIDNWAEMETRVITSEFQQLRSGIPGIRDDTILVLVGSRWQDHTDKAGELWNKRDRNEIALFAEATEDYAGVIGDPKRALKRALVHELAHAFGLRHMDWEGESFHKQSTVEGYSDLDSVQMCLSENSASYLREAPLPFVRPGMDAVPYAVVSYEHTRFFEKEPKDTVIAVPQTISAAEIAKIRDGYVVGDADIADLDEFATNQSELAATLSPTVESFGLHQTIKLKLTLLNHSKEIWYGPRAEDIIKPDAMASGSDMKALLLMPAVSEIKAVRAIRPGDPAEYDIEVSELPGFRSGGSNSGQTGQYSVRIAIPVTRTKGETTDYLVSATTTIALDSPQSPHSQPGEQPQGSPRNQPPDPLGSAIDAGIHSKLGPGSARDLQFILRFGFGLQQLKLKRFLEELLAKGLDGPQRPAICKADIISPPANNPNDSPDIEDFGVGSAVIPEEQLPKLTASSESLHDQPSSRVLLIGRADGTGSAVGNCRIARSRAMAARGALLLLGVAPTQIILVSRGSLDVGSGSSGQNSHPRRVDMQIFGAAAGPNQAITPEDCQGILVSAVRPLALSGTNRSRRQLPR